MGLADKDVLARAQRVERGILEHREHEILAVLIRRAEEERLRLGVPDRHIETDHLAGEAAPGARAVHDHIEVVAHTVSRLERNSRIAFTGDLGHLYSGLDDTAVGLHFLCEGIGDHRAVKVAVILGISCAEDIVGINVGQDLLNAGLVGDVLAAVASCLCQRDARLDALLLLLVRSDDERTRLVKARRTLLFLLELAIGLEAVKADVPVAVIQRVVKQAHGAGGLGRRAAANAILFKNGDFRLTGIEAQIVTQRSARNATANNSNLFHSVLLIIEYPGLQHPAKRQQALPLPP